MTYQESDAQTVDFVMYLIGGWFLLWAFLVFCPDADECGPIARFIMRFLKIVFIPVFLLINPPLGVAYIIGTAWQAHKGKF